MIFNYNQELGIASVEDKSTGIKVLTLLQNAGEKQPAINAYLLARYSRSNKSIYEIAEEVQSKNIDSAKNLGDIFHGYGHASVADAAQLLICIENVPEILATRFFYLNSVVNGQERSTRYQDFSQGEYLREDKEYNSIIEESFQNYRDLLEPTKEFLIKKFEIDPDDKKQKSVLAARTFDTVRYLLPFGHLTSFGAVMSARNWSTYISLMRGSVNKYERLVGELLFELLTLQFDDYVPESFDLIRYAEADSHIYDMTKEVVLAAKEYEYKHDPFRHYVLDSGFTYLLDHISLLANRKSHELRNPEFAEIVGEIVFKYCDRFHGMGNLGQSGAILLRGMIDLGCHKDFNRHRSFERFVPFFDDYCDMDLEIKNSFSLCPYILGSDLADEYSKRLKAHYESIENYVISQERSKNLVFNYRDNDPGYQNIKNLFPYAHNTRYRYYCSVDDLQYVVDLRTRNGGHIAYRQETETWLKLVSIGNPFWNSLIKKLPKVDAFDRSQFLDRS